MTFQPINTFTDVILYELQESKDKFTTSKTFSQLWTACSNAAEHLPEKLDPSDKQTFAKKLIQTIIQLETDGMIIVTRNNGKQIVSAKFTKDGKEKMDHTVFTFQQRLGKR